ncbi:hypothetical protein SASPL_108514 [Salvia splendens]|uniref:Kinesin motor domain-containing protein n=1 Tax=Salvia splendens TaxID=180675 RepID=A0A8X8YGU6_SALSN|nr:hypothetical protein SASPL_108514 [Salvia splendens]
MAPSPAPFLTPRPERRRPDSRGSDCNYIRSDKDKEMNVQVLLRCRPLTDDEQRLNMPYAITCNDSKREVTVSQSVGSKHVDRVFTFDKVFWPKSQQRSIYDQAISPIVAEVLEGFNCTVFAYGQTGTGKTYTMEGGMRNKGGELPIEAGIIPRAVRQIFDTLEAQNADYSMKVTFSELYNEEITDLLAPEDQLKSTEDRLKKPISLMEDGKGLVVVRGLEEETVYSANEIYSLLERVMQKVDKFRELYLTEQDEKLNIKSELKDCKRNLETTYKLLEDLKEKYKMALSTLKEKEALISKLQNSENSLVSCAKQLRVNLQDASQDISALFGKIDRKDKLEKENQSILLAFEVQLGESLKDLHEIIKSSVSQQERQMRCVEEYITTFLANKYKSNEAMEAKVKKLLEIYTTGSLDMKKVTYALKTKASSDLEEITSVMSAQTIAVENFFQTATLESKEVLSDIQKSLTEQKRMLAFSAQQHTEGLNKSLVSAQVISSAAINFSNDLHRRASELMTLLEQSHAEKSLRLKNFEQMFKEEASREEKLAMDQIAAILSTLTSKRTDMVVYKASKYFEESNTDESKKLLQELSNMQNLLSSEVRDLSEYAEKVKDHYMEETFSSAECIVAMENSLVECTENVETSSRQWQNAQLGTTHLAKNNLHDITSVMQTKIIETHRMHDSLASVSSCMDAEVDSHVNDLMMATNESLALDKVLSKEINTITLASLDQLNSMRVNHGECISHISSRSEQCIHKEYLVEQKTNVTPKKRATAVPSLESIEAMRTPVRDLDSKSRLKLDSIDIKIMQDPHRNPFQDVNGVI